MLTLKVWTRCFLIAYYTALQVAGKSQAHWLHHPQCLGSPHDPRPLIPCWNECLQFPGCVCLRFESFIPSTIKSTLVEFLWGCKGSKYNLVLEHPTQGKSRNRAELQEKIEVGNRTLWGLCLSLVSACLFMLF